MQRHERDLSQLIQYYVESDRAYKNWSQAGEDGVYSLHCGFHPDGIPIEQGRSVELMTAKVIEMSQIDNTVKKILDAGCQVPFSSVGVFNL